MLSPRPTHLLSLPIALLAASCVGTLDEKYPALSGIDGPDAGAATCDDPINSGHNGEHEQGQPCMPCHAAGGDGPTFTIAGTLYDDLAGSAAVSDAAIHIIDATGKDVALTTAANGNFWSTEPFAFPVLTYASLCPDTHDMISPLDESGGDCNKGGCHVAGFRVALP